MYQKKPCTQVKLVKGNGAGVGLQILYTPVESDARKLLLWWTNAQLIF
jgi:hypothetical protein